MCGGICYLCRELPNMFKCQVRSPSFLLSKSFLDASCRAQPHAGCKCLWERLVWNQITSCTSCVTLLKDSDHIASSSFHWPYSRQVRYVQAVLKQTCQKTTQLIQVWSEKSFLSLCVKVPWMQFAGHSHVQGASVYMGKAPLKADHELHVYKQVLGGTFMNHPGLWLLSKQHWSVQRHVTLWHKTLVTLPVTFPLTLLTISEEYSRSLEADIPEKVFPSPASDLLVCLPDRWDRFKQTHSQQPGRLEHTRTY